jgi:hypothetical protein
VHPGKRWFGDAQRGAGCAYSDFTRTWQQGRKDKNDWMLNEAWQTRTARGVPGVRTTRAGRGSWVWMEPRMWTLLGWIQEAKTDSQGLRPAGWISVAASKGQRLS